MSRRRAREASPSLPRKVPNTYQPAKDPIGPIWLAIEKLRKLWTEKTFESLKRLLQTSQVDLNASYRLTGDRPVLFFVVFQRFEGSTEVAEALLDAGASVNSIDDTGKNLLSVALIRRPDPTMISLLLDRGCDPNVACPLGLTAVHHAARSPCTDTLEIILEAGGKVNVQSKRAFAPLHSAAGSKHDNVLMLLKYGADPDPVEINGMTPLSIVLRSSTPREDTTAALLYHGAIPRKEDLELCVSDYSKSRILPQLERALGIAPKTTEIRVDWPHKPQKLH